MAIKQTYRIYDADVGLMVYSNTETAGYVWMVNPTSGEVECCEDTDGSELIVVPGSVERSIGRWDKNQQEIYEGDIIGWNLMTGVIYWEDCSFCLRWLGVYPLPDGEEAPRPDDLVANVPLNRSEVVGNIHENQELLDNA